MPLEKRPREAPLHFEHSDKVRHLQDRLRAFMDEHIHPNEDAFDAALDAAATRWAQPQLLEDLKAKARAAGLWNLFLPKHEHPDGLTNLEYAPLCEIMGRSHIAPEIFNCSAPDTGNMETLLRYATPAQQAQWLAPLLEGKSAPASP